MANSPKKLNQAKSKGNASLCINCGICLEKCSQEINIPDELKNVHLILKKGIKISDIYKDYKVRINRVNGSLFLFTPPHEKLEKVTELLSQHNRSFNT